MLMKTHNSSITIQEEFVQKIQDDNRKEKLMQLAPLLVLVGLIVVFTCICGTAFVSPGNFINLMNQLALPLVVALGLTFVIMLGSIDLSIDGTVGMAGSVFACLVMNTQNDNDFGFAGVILAILLSTLCGMLIGLCHVYLRIPSFMASFAFMYICSYTD